MSSNIFRPNGGTPVIAEKAVMGFSGTDISAVLFLPQFELDGFDRLASYQSDVPDILRNRGPLAYKLGAIQTLTYSVYDEKTPIRSIGFKNPMGMARGNRTIAGSLIFGQLFNHVFDDAGQVRRARVVEDSGGILSYSAGSITYLDWEDESDTAYREQLVNRRHQYDFTWDSGGFGERLKISEVPPFDIILLFVNEMGNVGKMIIYGIEIVHESGVLSIDDIYTEVTYQYIARDIEIFHPASFSEGRSWRARSWESPANRNRPGVLDVALAVDAASDRLMDAVNASGALSEESEPETVVEPEMPEDSRLLSFWELLDPTDQSDIMSLTGLSIQDAELLVNTGSFKDGSNYISFAYSQTVGSTRGRALSNLVDLINNTDNQSTVGFDNFSDVADASTSGTFNITDITSSQWEYSIFIIDENDLRDSLNNVFSDEDIIVTDEAILLDMYNNPWDYNLEYSYQQGFSLLIEEYPSPEDAYNASISPEDPYLAPGLFLNQLQVESPRQATRNLIYQLAINNGIYDYQTFRVHGVFIQNMVHEPGPDPIFQSKYRVAVRNDGPVTITYFTNHGLTVAGVIDI